MHPRQVVVLREVLHDELPVGGHVERAGRPVELGGAPLGEAVGRQPLRQIAEPLVERRRVVAEADEHERPPRLGADGDQPVVGHVEIASGHFVEQRRSHELAVGAVVPAVVGAANGVGDVAIAFGQLGAPVTAGVQEAVQPGVGAGQQDRASAHRTHQQPTRPGDLFGKRHRHPRPPEQPLLLSGEEAFVGVDSRLHGERRVHCLLLRRPERRPRLGPVGFGPHVERL